MLKQIPLLCCLSLLSLPASAAIYQFTGVVDTVNGDDVTFAPGDAFNFVIEIDFSSPGYVQSIYDSSTIQYQPAGYYAAEYVSGDAVQGVNWDGWSEHYYWDNTAGNTAVIDVLNQLSIIAASGSGGIQNWNAGTTINFSQVWRTDASNPLSSNTIYGHITNVSAVPVPAAVWLFVSGIAALLGISRRP